MRRAAILASLLAACAVAGACAALAVADVPPPPTTTTATTTTGATTTGATTTSPVATLPAGVTVGGVAVGGLAPADAQTALQTSFERPIVLRYRRTTIEIAPEVLGATAGIDRALEKAASSAPNTAVPLQVNVRPATVSAFVSKVVRRFTRTPVDARLLLRDLHPVITRSRVGVQFAVRPIADAVVKQLVANVRTPIVLKPKRIEPNVSDRSFPSVIVIRRGSNRLYLYRDAHYWRLFPVATGQAAYPTPLGRFQIVVMWKNPWWYPPASPWAKGAKPIPPGPGNPLGTRWMGLSAAGVGIHGTPDAASIGYSASHGCIRMRIPDAEWLFNHVQIGTTVFIVSA